MINNKSDINFKKLDFLLKKLNLEFPVAELSRKTGYKEGTISPYLSGKIKPSSKFLQSIIESFRINLDGFEEIIGSETLSIISDPIENYVLKAENIELKKINEDKDRQLSKCDKLIECLEDKIQMLEFSLGKKNGTA